MSKTSVTKIPSLSRVGQPSSIIIEVAGHDQLEIIITGTLCGLLDVSALCSDVLFVPVLAALSSNSFVLFQF